MTTPRKVQALFNTQNDCFSVAPGEIVKEHFAKIMTDKAPTAGKLADKIQKLSDTVEFIIRAACPNGRDRALARYAIASGFAVTADGYDLDECEEDEGRHEINQRALTAEDDTLGVSSHILDDIAMVFHLQFAKE